MAPAGRGRLPLRTDWPNRLEHQLNGISPDHQSRSVIEQALNSGSSVTDDPLELLMMEAIIVLMSDITCLLFYTVVSQMMSLFLGLGSMIAIVV